MGKRGSILLFSLIVMAITVFVTGGLCTYYVSTMHTAQFFADRRSSRRVGASRALRKAFEKVQEVIPTADSAVGTAVSLGGQGKSVADVLDEMKKAVPKTMTIDGETYTLKAETHAEDKSVPEDALRISAVIDGITVVSVTIELNSVTDSLSTLSVFDYVYFVDNNGRLNSSYIIANGEVGSNGDFDLSGATVNGYVRYRNTVRLSNDPHAWLQAAYMAKIAAEFEVSKSATTVIEQARPTNPSLSVENGKTTTIAWPGGYEYLESTNPYTFTETEPTPVSPPGSKPKAPSKSDIVSTTKKR